MGCDGPQPGKTDGAEQSEGGWRGASKVEGVASAKALGQEGTGTAEEQPGGLWNRSLKDRGLNRDGLSQWGLERKGYSAQMGTWGDEGHGYTYTGTKTQNGLSHTNSDVWSPNFFF